MNKRNSYVKKKEIKKPPYEERITCSYEMDGH